MESIAATEHSEHILSFLGAFLMSSLDEDAALLSHTVASDHHMFINHVQGCCD